MDRFFRYKLDHWVFWTGTVLFHAFTRLHLIDKAGVGQFLLEIVGRNTLLAAVIYLNLKILIPRFAADKKYLHYIVFLLLSITVYVLLKNAHDLYLYSYVIGDSEHDYFRNSFYNMSIALFYMAFSVAIYLSKEWYFQKALIRRIEIEKLNTELDYLKSQINPHFLFNSINTIYFQIDKQNTSARETLLTFSDMLRYQLYECNGKEIPIEKEVQYLKNYTGLQRMRKDENYKINFDSGPEVANFTIVPLLLIPFVENAFKYVSHFTTDSNEIDIRLSKEENKFAFRIYNTKDQIQQVGGGIGLKNVRRRLELLYPDRHELSITDTDKTFEVILRVEIR